MVGTLHHDNKELAQSDGEAVHTVQSSGGDERKERARAAKTRVFSSTVRELFLASGRKRGRSLLGGSSGGHRARSRAPSAEESRWKEGWPCGEVGDSGKLIFSGEQKQDKATGRTRVSEDTGRDCGGGKIMEGKRIGLGRKKHRGTQE